MKSIKIKVYRSNRSTGEWHRESELEYIETITRVPFHKGFFGNFVPHFCRYKNKVYPIYGSIDSSYMHGYYEDAYINIDRPYKETIND